MLRIFKIHLFVLINLSVLACGNSTTDHTDITPAPNLRVAKTKEEVITEKQLHYDTISSIHSPFGYEIKLSNYVLNNAIHSSLIDMKNHICLEYNLDTIIRQILINEQSTAIGLEDFEEDLKIVKNEFSLIRAHNLYFDVQFTFKDKMHRITYGLTYSGRKKGRFWRHKGLIRI